MKEKRLKNCIHFEPCKDEAECIVKRNRMLDNVYYRRSCTEPGGSYY